MADIAAQSKTYNVADHLIHGKSDNGEEVILLPYTRYDNVMGAPRVVSTYDDYIPAPFFFLKTDEVDLTADEINTLVGVQMASEI